MKNQLPTPLDKLYSNYLNQDLLRGSYTNFNLIYRNHKESKNAHGCDILSITTDNFEWRDEWQHQARTVLLKLPVVKDYLPPLNLLYTNTFVTYNKKVNRKMNLKDTKIQTNFRKDSIDKSILSNCYKNSKCKISVLID